MKYRREIDGLRALAVIPVILFHAGFTTFQGGFIGVDIFFVISGYLITSIIQSQLLIGQFSLLDFYERRARRILPTLYLIMLICIPFAWFLMLPDYLENFGQSLVATTFFSNNILLYLTSGYFALESEFKPLLHTWSLGVEEQYYIIFPLLCMIVYRYFQKKLIWLALAIFITSLTYAQWLLGQNPEAAFYLLTPRAWELIAGATISILISSRSEPEITEKRNNELSEFDSAGGLILVLLSIFLFSKNTPTPGFYTLIPVVGVLLIIFYASHTTVVGKILGHPWLVGIGLVSYSAYLWHQPLFAFARLMSLEEPPQLLFAALTLASFILAFISWKFIETPFRSNSIIERKYFISIILILGIGIAGLGYLFYATSGFLYFNKELNSGITKSERRQNAAFNERPYQFKDLEYKDPSQKHILIIGNSFARDFINSGIENNYFSNSEISYSDNFPVCISKNINSKLITLISNTNFIIYGSSPSGECWQDDLVYLNSLGVKKIIVIGTKNFGWNMNAVMRLNPDIRYQYKAKVLDFKINENINDSAFFGDGYYVDIIRLIGDANSTVPVFTDTKAIISQDRMHLTREGARFIGKIIFNHPLLLDFK